MARESSQANKSLKASPTATDDTHKAKLHINDQADSDEPLANKHLILIEQFAAPSLPASEKEMSKMKGGKGKKKKEKKRKVRFEYICCYIK